MLRKLFRHKEKHFSAKHLQSPPYNYLFNKFCLTNYNWFVFYMHTTAGVITLKMTRSSGCYTEAI
jgi:hypothetical protein